MPTEAAASRSATLLTLPGLSAAVEIRYDIWGVPHVTAGPERDLFVANGWIHARDRLWQMDAARRRALGRWAEWVGAEGLASDRLMRKLGIEAVSRADYAALSAQTKAMCEAYSAGVNAFIAAGDLPPEYALLAETPEPWEPWHCVVVMRQRGLLMGSVWFKLWRAAAYAVAGPENLHLLRYEDGGIEEFVTPQDRQQPRWTAALKDLAPAIEGLQALFPTDVTGGGSNNWAINARHSTTGMPIVAGDPHRAYEIPAMYTQAHLRCDSFAALGLTMPGVPLFPHFGHNEDMAWCVTHAFADIHDLYVEDFRGQEPGHYRTATGSAKARLRKEVIGIRGGAEEEIEIWETANGPLILGSPGEGAGLALKSMQLQAGDTSLDCLRPMVSQKTVAAFYDLMEPWGLIDHNLVAADRQDTIGVQVRARIPERDRKNGWLPVPGWDPAFAWRGIIPFARMPREENPGSGIIVTANNRTVPEDWPDYICTDCHPSTRAKRIRSLLSTGAKFSPADMLDLLYDHSSAVAKEFAARFLARLPQAGPGREMVLALQGWAGDMEAGKLAPTVYYTLRQQMTRILARRSGLDQVAGQEIAKLPPGISPLTHLWWALPDQLRRDDTSLLGGASWDEVIDQAISECAEGFLPRPWGEAHRPVFAHPLTAQFKEAAGFAPASAPVSGDGDCVLATGALPSGGLVASYGPVAKYIWDLSDWDNCSWVVFHGASGIPGDAHYSDQNTPWSRGTLVPAPWSDDQIRAATRQLITLNPA
ncbi:penicillin acylase family protein [Falsigemmobacter faecalis]|uniref:Penicillin acylase family protein n=1 Tax=Falsigemmobacter faecalis TaxID=2488730 RepID=A0A3P3DPF6_9RHOB|nr:penicillin acylase family protein [Falsigemmobacter faecalis]RRH76147.1 penicillin acylase family protein [Falsigemmobacter faecalis]